MTETQVRPKLLSAPHIGLTGWAQHDYTNDIREEAHKYNLVNSSNVNLGGDYSKPSQLPILLFSEQSIDGIYFRDYIDPETFRKRQIEEKTHKERLAKEYIWTILTGGDANR